MRPPQAYRLGQLAQHQHPGSRQQSPEGRGRKIRVTSSLSACTVLGNSKWENFSNVINKAKIACENVGHNVDEHFPDVRKTIAMPKGAEKQIDNYLLTRYACYLIAQNGDPRKEQVAFAQTYFAVQTRKAELIEQRLLEVERVKARAKLQETEKKLSGVLYERGVNDKSFAVIRSKGDQALFRLNTATLKRKMGVPASRPLADFLPTISIKAKGDAAFWYCSRLTSVTIPNSVTTIGNYAFCKCI